MILLMLRLKIYFKNVFIYYQKKKYNYSIAQFDCVYEHQANSVPHIISPIPIVLELYCKLLTMSQ